MEKRVFENYYFKAGNNISGVQPPFANAHFINCDFHTNLKLEMFKDCRFDGCYFQNEDKIITINIPA